MVWWQWYLTLSLGVGLVFTTYSTVYRRFYPNPLDSVEEEVIKNGHLQKEVFGDRTVLYPKDNHGQGFINAKNFHDNLQKHKVLVFVLRVLVFTVLWPYELYGYMIK